MLFFGELQLSSSDKTVSSGFESTKTGFNIGTEFEQYSNFYVAPAFSLNHEKITAQSGSSDAIKKMEGNFTNIDFSYSLTSDKRNQSFQPTSGYLARFTQSMPIIMDSSSFQNGITINSYHAISDDIIGKVKVYGNSIHGIDEDVRLTNRLFIPQNRLRGFNSARVGPKDGSDWVGGNFLTALGFEAALPNLLPESTKTDVSLFFDSANVWKVDYNSDLDGGNKIRSSVGLAANVFTVIGPLTFTLAQDLTSAATDETETFNFRIGTSF